LSPFVDASVLLRVALRQPDALPEWQQIQQGVSSPLCNRNSCHAGGAWCIGV
jgi:hypothetical protein